MAFRLDDSIIAGFIKNAHRFSTHGRLALRGGEMPIMFELTGSPSPDLCGRTFEFEVPQNIREASEEDKRLAAGLRPIQVGVTGEMTAERMVRTFECSPEEFIRRSELGEPPPTRWEACLYLEWFSQNGRVVIELPVSKLHILDEDEIAARDREEQEEIAAEMRRMEEEDRMREATTPEITAITPEGETDLMDLLSDDDDEEGYGLIPEELESELARNARRVDREVAGEPPDAIRMMEETELMDEMLEKGERTPLMEFLSDLKLPSPSDISNEAEAEKALNAALMKLALAGVAFHVCEHCSATDAYRILIDEICQKSEDTGAFRPLIGTGWVQNFCASDYCARCQADE